MNKKWLILIIFLIILLIFWQIGGINYLLARTVFAPDYNPDLIEEESEEESSEKSCGGALFSPRPIRVGAGGTS